MKQFIAIMFITFLLVLFGFGQEIRDQREAERVYKQSMIEQKYNKQYFDEMHRCERLINEQKFKEAEASCRLSISYAEKLPKESYMERYSANAGTGVALLRQRSAREAILYFEKALEIAKPILDDTDSETGDVYFLLGQAYHVLKDIPNARLYYEKAEKSYRTAFVEIGDDAFFLSPYGKKIKNIVEAHFILLQDAGLNDDAEKLKLRLAETKKEFVKYLEN